MTLKDPRSTAEYCESGVNDLELNIGESDLIIGLPKPIPINGQFLRCHYGLKRVYFETNITHTSILFF